MLLIFLKSLVISLIWFVAGSLLYMNPFVARIYRRTNTHPSVKKWPETKKYLGFQFLAAFIQIFLWFNIFLFIKPTLPATLIGKTFSFAGIIIAIKILPRLIDMWLQTTYPPKLLIIELINGSIGAIIKALLFAILSNT